MIASVRRSPGAHHAHSASELRVPLVDDALGLIVVEVNCRIAIDACIRGRTISQALAPALEFLDARAW